MPFKVLQWWREGKGPKCSQIIVEQNIQVDPLCADIGCVANSLNHLREPFIRLVGVVPWESRLGVEQLFLFRLHPPDVPSGRLRGWRLLIFFFEIELDPEIIACQFGPSSREQI